MIKRLTILLGVSLILFSILVAGIYLWARYGYIADLPSTNTFRLENEQTKLLAEGLPITENDWLANDITKELVGMTWLAGHSKESLPEFKTKATLEVPDGIVHAHIEGAGPTVALDFPVTYAWDPTGYLPLAKQLIGDLKPIEPGGDDSAILTDLLTPTGKTVASQDVTLSKALSDLPNSVTLHEQAAFLLLVEALRENAGPFSDTRRLMDRATAHLALVQALRGASAPGVVEKLADATLATLAGREVDALGQLDALDPQSSDSVKIWIRILRLLNKMDWRMESPKATDPLMLRIAWFNTLVTDLDETRAWSKLAELGKTEDVTDWGRALLSGSDHVPVDIGHKFCQSTLGLEFTELATVLNEETGETITRSTKLSTLFNDPLQDSVYSKDGVITESVIGAPLFKNIALRHLFSGVWSTHMWMLNSWGVPDEDAKMVSDMETLFAGVPHFKQLTGILTIKDPDKDQIENPQFDEDLSELPFGLTEISCWTWSSGEFSRYLEFFSWNFPFNAPQGTDARVAMVNYRVSPGHIPRKPKLKSPQMLDMQPLSPYNYDIVSWILVQKEQQGKAMTKDEEEALLSPFFDYNSNSLSYFKTFSKKQNDFDDATLETIWRKECVLDPDEYFNLGDFLYSHGRIDEAIQAYQTASTVCQDHVYWSNCIGPLVKYDYTHGKQDEAVQLAQRASEIYSFQGIDIYIWVLIQQNKLSDAEDWAHKEADRYGENNLISFYAQYRDQFPDQFDKSVKNVLPGGLKATSLASLSGAPTCGIQFASSNSSLSGAGLKPSDVVVALDGYLVSDENSYSCIRGLTTDANMTFIVWRDGHYQEVKVNRPGRHFGVNLLTYPHS